MQLIQAPILQYPDFDKEFIVYTDASGTGLGTVLSQKDENGRERVIAYASRSLNKHEQNYGITDQEGLAVIWAIKHFHHYLCLKHFTVVTDHSALKFLKTSQIPTGRRGRWMMELQQHNFSIIHRPGKNNANADALSRIPEKEVHILMVETRASKRRRLASEITNPISYPYDEEDDSIEWVDYTNRLTLGNYPTPEEDESMPDSPIIDPYYEESNGGWGSDEGDHDNWSQAGYEDDVWHMSNSEDEMEIVAEGESAAAYRYNCDEVAKAYAALIKIKQVIAGQPITRGGSQCTDACDIENHHIHTYCSGCKRNLMYGTTIHPCDVRFAMDAAGLTNTPWWIEPLLVQQENNYTYLRFLQRILNGLSFYEPNLNEIQIADLD